MSFKDTIRGAREEAGANVASWERTKDADKGKNEEAASSANQQGFVRKSASKAKPSRQAAAGVRMVTSDGKAKSKKNMTKEEAKAERKRDREIDDLRYNVTQKLLDERDDYSKARKVWWRFLIVGVTFVVLAFIQYAVVSNMGADAPTWIAFTSMGCMVLAYATLIIGLIYDWRTIRPIRKDVDSYVQSMSEKRLITAINKAPKDNK